MKNSKLAPLSAFVLAACVLALAAGPAFASPQEMGKVSADDLTVSKKSPAGGRVYSPYVGRAYPDQV